MKKMKKSRLAVVLLSSVMTLATIPFPAFAETSNYTYTYDYWNELQSSPNTYEVTESFTGMEFGGIAFNNPQGMFVHNDKIYICDTNNDRIVVLNHSDKEFTLDTIIDSFDANGLDVTIRHTINDQTSDGAEKEADAEGETKVDESQAEGEEGTEKVEEDTTGDGEEDAEAVDGTTAEGTEDADGAAEGTVEADTPSKTGDNSKVGTAFFRPYDIFVDDDDTMYVCDYGHCRIVKISKDLKLLQIVDDPKDNTLDNEKTKFIFKPKKMVVDDTGRLFVLAENINKGFMAFDPSGEFTGYIGANKVTFSAWDRFWKRFATEKQKEKMVNFVPTTYNNIALSTDGFFMATTDEYETSDLRDDEKQPIRKLNSQGSDILIRNGYNQPMGDIRVGTAAGYTGPSKIIDATTLDNNTYFLIDRNRGRIFAYDSQGNLLYGFGGPGNKEGYFQSPSAIDVIGRDLLILDYSANTLTVMTLTEYGKLINSAIETYQVGDYDGSAQYWEEVLKYNGNYTLAYIGIGRSLLRKDQYKEAMDYFKQAYDYDNYSKAFKLYRKEWIEDNIGWIFALVVVIILVPAVISKVKSLIREVEDIE